MLEITRKTLIITFCLLLSKTMHLNVGVFLVLNGIILANGCPVNNPLVMFKILLPPFLTALAAVMVNQVFSGHPFIIWALSILYFDFMMKNADTNLKARAALMPLFQVIFIDTYANSDFVMVVPEIMRDLFVSIVFAVITTYIVNIIIPVTLNSAARAIIKLPVTGAARLKMLILVGGGLAFLIFNQVTSATFCLVPVIAAVLQPTKEHMKIETGKRIVTQVGGCCGAMILSALFMGTEINIVTFFLVSFAMVLTLMKWCECEDPFEQSMHSDAVTGILVPYQLYIGKYGNNFGLDFITLRAVELVMALLVVYFVATMLEKKKLIKLLSESKSGFFWGFYSVYSTTFLFI